MTLPQPVKFLVIGACGYFVNLALFATLYAAGVPYGACSVAAYLASNALMYVGNRFYTFGMGATGFWPGYLRYFLVGLVVAALNALMLTSLVQLLDMHPTAGAAVSMLLITPIAFVLNKRWTFSEAPVNRSNPVIGPAPS